MKWRSKLGQVLDTSQDGPLLLCSLKLHSCLRIIPIVESNGNSYLNKQQNFQIIECNEDNDI